MIVTLGQAGHISRLLNGFESIMEEIPNDDTKYVHTCLSLNGVEMLVDGQEGFVDAIKNAGVKFYQMIKNFLKMIRDFFTGSKGRAADQAVTKAVAQGKEIAKEAPKAFQAAEPEKKEKLEAAAVRLDDIAFEPLPASLRAIDQRYTSNKDGFMTDIKKTAVTAGGMMTDFSADIDAINGAYLKLENYMVRRKDGSHHGFVKSVGDAAEVMELVQYLRQAYKRLQEKLLKPTEDFNELHNKLTDEKAKRAAQKITRFLASLSNDLGRSIDACTKLIDRIQKALAKVGVLVEVAAPSVIPNTMRISGPVDLDKFMGYDTEIV